MIVRIPEDLKQDMDKAPGIDWSKIARDAIRERTTELVLLKAIASKSKLTEKDALELGRKVKRGLHERYKKLYPGLE